jgi:hypothetical protein
MPRAYCRGKRIKALHARYGVTKDKTCGTCGRMTRGRCPYDYKRGHWNRAWPACGLFKEQDDDMEGFEWVDTDDGWKLRRKS